MTTTNDMASLKQSIEAAANKGVPIMGAIVQYSVSEEAKVTSDSLAAATPSCVPASKIPSPPTEAHIARRAVRVVNSRRNKQGWELRPVGGDPSTGAVYYSMVAFHDDPQSQMSKGTPVATLQGIPTIDYAAPPSNGSAAQSIKWDVMRVCNEVEEQQQGLHPGACAESFTKAAAEARAQLEAATDTKVWADRVRLLVGNVLSNDMGAFRTRPAGGCYFVPADRLDDFNEWRDSWHGLFGERVRFSALPVLGDDYSKTDLAHEFTRQMTSDIDAFEHKVTKFFSDGRDKQPRSIAAKHNELDQLCEQVKQYEHLLGVQQDKLTNATDKIREYLNQRVEEALLASTTDEEIAGGADAAIPTASQTADLAQQLIDEIDASIADSTQEPDDLIEQMDQQARQEDSSRHHVKG